MKYVQTPIENIKTVEQARNEAIVWQSWASEQDMSLFDLALWQVDFTELAEKFNLTDEFKENGII